MLNSESEDIRTTFEAWNEVRNLGSLTAGSHAQADSCFRREKGISFQFGGAEVVAKNKLFRTVNPIAPCRGGLSLVLTAPA